MKTNWCANQTNDMFYPFCIIRSRKPCKTQRTDFPLFLPFSKLSEMPVRSYLCILQGISTQNEFLRFVPFLPLSKSSETPVQSYLRILQGISTRNEFLRFVPLLPFSTSFGNASTTLLMYNTGNQYTNEKSLSSVCDLKKNHNCAR